mmetsp:Transcript_71209/g.170020  ORF Transcript_71209/g.170020 Transcript_71209/m.170020 type:complete len:115 (+) Transcript_71209:538-882(+)
MMRRLGPFVDRRVHGIVLFGQVTGIQGGRAARISQSAEGPPVWPKLAQPSHRGWALVTFSQEWLHFFFVLAALIKCAWRHSCHQAPNAMGSLPAVWQQLCSSLYFTVAGWPCLG